MHKVFDLLDLDLPNLEKVKAAVGKKNNQQALKELGAYYRLKGRYTGFLNGCGDDLSFVEAEIQKIPKEEKEHIFKVAKQLEQQSFLFQEPWDMERTRNVIHFDKDINWLLNPDHDIEWIFMMNRHNNLNLLAQAYLLTKEHKYTQIFSRLISDWLEKNDGPEGFEMTSWRRIETGIRLRNWVKCLEVFLSDPCFSAELLADIVVSTVKHLQYLEDGWTINRLQTNWVILEGNGAYLAALFFHELKIAPQKEKFISAYLEQAALTQETSEGMHWEQSYQYHNEVLLKLAEVYLIGQRNQRSVPENIKKVIFRMSKVSAHIKKPDGSQDNYGDSDREKLDDLLLLLEQITRLSLLDKHISPIPNRFVLTHYGTVKNRLDPVEPLYQNSHALDEAGIYILKNETNQFHAQFKCGFLGHGHGHDDLLHLSLFADGEDILIDSGRHSYEDAHHHRLTFKSQAYHNTTMVDGISINEYANCWDASKVAHQLNSKFRFTDQADFVEGGHLGYLALKDPLYTNRKIIYVKPDILLIVDEFLGRGKHQYQQNFHFNLNHLALGKSSNQLVYENSKGKKYYIENFHSESPNAGQWELSQQYVSDDYNEKHLAPKATFTLKADAPAAICTFINLSGEPKEIRRVPVLNESDSKRKRSNASAFWIDNGKYIVINHYEDADSRRAYIVDGHQVYGRVALIETAEQKNRITRIY